MKHILFFRNGNTAVLVDGEQVPELQKPWATLVAEFLEASGHDPTDFALTFPDGGEARFFRTPSGWNWEFNK